MSQATQSIFPLENAKLFTNLDANNLQIVNLDVSNLGLVGGGGNDTGTTTAILKGDGNHGFANAIADTDYASPAAVALKEDTASHDADISALTITTGALGVGLVQVEATLAEKADTTDLTDGLALKADDADLQAYITATDSELALKAYSSDLISGLVTKAEASDLSDYITANDAEVALKAYSSDVTTALSGKADTGATASALAGKEPLLPTTANDAWLLARHNAGAGGAWYFVDPVTLGTANQTFVDGVENSTTTFTSATANFTTNDVGKSITGANIPGGTTIASRTNSTTIVLSAAATATATDITFTIYNRITTGGTGTVTSVAVTNNVTDLLTISVANPTSSAAITIDPNSTVGANRFYGNFTAFAGQAGFGTASAARNSLGGTTVGQALFQLTNPTAISYPRINADNTVTTRTPAQTLTDLGAEAALTFSSPLARAVNAISIPAATDSVSGHLTAADHAAFNAKISPTRTITTTAPLTGGGDLSANRTLSMPAATASVDGYLTAANFAAFNAKAPGTRTINTTAPLAGGGALTSDLTLSMPAATISASGYMTAAAFADFNSKPPSTRQISTTAPLTGGGDLSANRTIAMPAASASTDGYLTAGAYAQFSNLVPVAASAPASGSMTISDVTPPVTRILLSQQLTGPLAIYLPSAFGYGASLGFPFIEIVDIVPGGAHGDFDITINRKNATTELIDGVASITIPRGIGYIRINSNGLARWTTTKYFVDSFIDASDETKQARVDVSGIPTATIRSLKIAGGADSTTVIPSTGDSGNGLFVYDYDANGNALRASPGTGLPDTTGKEGYQLQVVGGVWTATASGSGSSPWVVLSPSFNPVVWTPLANQQQQNAVVTLSADRDITISSTNLQSGMAFDLMVIQDGTGGHAITSLPLGTVTPDDGQGLLPQTLTAGAIDWYHLRYTGIAGSTWVASTRGLNLTAAAVVVPTCNTAGVAGAPSGTNIVVCNSPAFTYISNTFTATAAAICRVDANLLRVGAPNFNMHMGIYSDAVRTNGTKTDGVTTSGSATVTSVTGNWTADDLFQRVTVSAGFAATSYYIGVVNSATSIGISSSRTSNVPVNATSSTTGTTVTTYGSPGIIIGSGSTNNPSSTTITTDLTTASATPVSFTGIGTTGLTVGGIYHVVLWADGNNDSVNHIDWLYGGATAFGHTIKRSSNGVSLWTAMNAARKTRYATYGP